MKGECSTSASKLGIPARIWITCSGGTCAMMKILVPIDFSEVSPRVIELAKLFAGGLDAEIILLHVVSPDPEFVGYDAGPKNVRDSVAREIRWEHGELQRLAGNLREEGFRAEALVVRGSVPEKILQKSEKLGVDLLIMGRHRHGIVKDVLLGNVSRTVLKKAGRPVTLVP